MSRWYVLKPGQNLADFLSLGPAAFAGLCRPWPQAAPAAAARANLLRSKQESRGTSPAEPVGSLKNQIRDRTSKSPQNAGVQQSWDVNWLTCMEKTWQDSHTKVKSFVID